MAGLAAIGHESLWIDEANSALKAMQPSLASWWHVLASEKGSDLQMPLYMLWLWAWEKLAGHSEFALRAANLPWLIVAHFFLFRAGRASALGPLPVLLIASLNPFLWTYLNEARPYVMQYAAACILCALLFETAENQSSGTTPKGLWFLGGGLVLLCGSSLLGVIWAAFAGVAWLFLIRGRLRDLLRTRAVLPLAVLSVCLGGLGLYYAWTLRLGAGASTAARTSLLNIAFVGYELAGIAGLGPGRLDIRENAFGAFRDFGVAIVPLVVASLVCLGFVANGLSRAWKDRSRRAIIAGGIYAIPASAFLLALGFIQHFRILGRHFTPLVPVILGLIFFGLSAMRRRTAINLCATLAVIWCASALSLRFSARHRKDDYRTAASVATAAVEAGESVWWSADRSAAIYYRVPLDGTSAERAQEVTGLTAAQLTAQAVPDLVVASKADLYDPTGDLGTFLRERRFVPVRILPAFTIWRRPPVAPAER